MPYPNTLATGSWGLETTNSVLKLPPDPKVAAIAWNPETGHVGEVGGSQVGSVPIDVKTVELHLNQAAQEGGPLQRDRRSEGIPSNHSGSPGLQAESQLQIEDATGKLTEEFRPDGGRVH